MLELLGVPAAGAVEDAAEDRARDLHRQVVVVAVDRVLAGSGLVFVIRCSVQYVSRNAALVEMRQELPLREREADLGKMSKRERL